MYFPYSWFQSSPGAMAGCNHCPTVTGSWAIWFQSSPGAMAGCNSSCRGASSRAPAVSILTRRDGRVQLRLLPRPLARMGVSILTRRDGRVQPLEPPSDKVPATRFNPHPARWPGATPRYEQTQIALLVSILTRRDGRVQLGVAVGAAPDDKRFNPHPARWPGATGAPPAPKSSQFEFQSSPGAMAGCNLGCEGMHLSADAFQSSPGAMAGCNLVVTLAVAGNARFQSSPGAMAGCNARRHAAPACFKRFQSSPGAMAGCNFVLSNLTRNRSQSFNPHPARWPGATVPAGNSLSNHVCFNPHPARWPGATPRNRIIQLDFLRFQSSPGAMAGCNATATPRPAATVCFNPHPARWPGATVAIDTTASYRERFNPHPARWPGATRASVRLIGFTDVSILTRRDGRVQLEKPYILLTVRLFFWALNGNSTPLEAEKLTKFGAFSPLWHTRFRDV